jgi:hypothetical protein
MYLPASTLSEPATFKVSHISLHAVQSEKFEQFIVRAMRPIATKNVTHDKHLV